MSGQIMRRRVAAAAGSALRSLVRDRSQLPIQRDSLLLHRTATAVIDRPAFRSFSLTASSSSSSSSSSSATTATSGSTPIVVSSLPPLIVHRGVVSRPMTWSELASAVREQRWGGLGRLAHIQEAYNMHKKEVKAGGQSMGAFIQQRVFGQKSNQPADASTASDSASPSTSSMQLVWTPNAFPYGAEAGVHHDLLWCTTSSADGLDPIRLQSEVHSRFPPSEFETICWVNPIENRSIKDVFHAHVFWRRRRQTNGVTNSTDEAETR